MTFSCGFTPFLRSKSSSVTVSYCWFSENSIPLSTFSWLIVITKNHSFDLIASFINYEPFSLKTLMATLSFFRSFAWVLIKSFIHFTSLYFSERDLLCQGIYQLCNLCLVDSHSIPIRPKSKSQYFTFLKQKFIIIIYYYNLY